MNIENEKVMVEEAKLERELAQLAPLFRDAFSAQGGPSERVMNVLYREAKREAGLRAGGGFFRNASLFRKIAASLALLLGGFLLYRQTPAMRVQGQVRTQQKMAAATGATATWTDAELLLDIQGMDAESFLTGEEEVLWL